ncbi:MAG: hypothetical protein IT200_00085 [Thermoleophilia bacterium]|nr:hypothetical protein [Thermoleophilia bacterium]
MDLSSITPQQKMLGAAGASVLFAIAMLFFTWAGVGPITFTGMDLLPSAWIFLILTLVAVAAFAAAAFDYELPIPFNPLALGTYCISVPFIITLALMLDGGSGRKWGLYLAVIFGLVATALGTWLWRTEEA